MYAAIRRPAVSANFSSIAAPHSLRTILVCQLPGDEVRKDGAASRSLFPDESRRLTHADGLRPTVSAWCAGIVPGHACTVRAVFHF
jgi:hypothetical protein